MKLFYFDVGHTFEAVMCLFLTAAMSVREKSNQIAPDQRKGSRLRFRKGNKRMQRKKAIAHHLMVLHNSQGTSKTLPMLGKSRIAAEGASTALLAG